MAIKVKEKDWKVKEFRESVLTVAETFGQDIVIQKRKQKFKPYNVQIWLNDNIEKEKDFLRKSQAMKWLKSVLMMHKYEKAYADLKKYNQNDDDFDYWFYSKVGNKVIEVPTIEE